jgi:hypothetical protein
MSLKMHFLAVGLASILSPALAREITFPPIAAIQSDQFILGQHEKNIDIVSGSQFSGLTTFAHIPYVNCFIDSEAESSPYDIAILGAPFDTVSHRTCTVHVAADCLRRFCRELRLAQAQDTDPEVSDSARAASKAGTSTRARTSLRVGQNLWIAGMRR